MDNSFPTLFSSVDVVEQVLNEFQDAWKRGNPPTLSQFFERLQDESPAVRDSVQLMMVLQDQTLRWKLWKRQCESMGDTVDAPGASTERAPLLEDYVRYCSLESGLQTLPPELIAHEFRLRAECGDLPTLDDYLQRFPHLSESLPALLSPVSDSDGSQLTDTKDDAPTAVDPALTQIESKRDSLGTTLPMSPEEMPKRRKRQVENKNAGFGQYELLNEIARGAMGVVYRARHVTIDKIVALKMILAGQFASERQVDQFLLEAQNAGRLEHDNIVRIYDAGKINDQYYIAMAYIEGQSLGDSIREQSLSDQRAAEIVESVARALHFAHTQPDPVYHRDIKPANILLDHSGRPYVTDFGIAKRVERENLGANDEDDIAGTPSYMPPEQTYGRDIGPWSDVYSTGAMMYHLLTGRPPFLTESLLETIRHVREVEPLPPSELNPKVDPDLEAVCLKCLEKDRTKRYASAEELANDLRRFLQHEPTQARPISQLGRFSKWCRRNPTIARLAAAIVLLLTSVAITAVFVAREQSALRGIAEEKKELANKEREKAEKAFQSEKVAKEKEEKAKEEAIQSEKAAIEAQRKAVAAQKEEEVAKELALMAKKKEEDARKEAEKAEAEAKKAKSEADAARVLAEANLQKAIQTVNVILTRSAESRLKDVPGMEEFRKRVAQDALEQLEPILQANAKQKEALEAQAKVFVVLAKLFDITGQSDQAEKYFASAINEYSRLKELGSGKSANSMELIAAYRQWGDSLTDRAKVDQSTTDRPLEPESERLLNQAIQKYSAALDIAAKMTGTTDGAIDVELARIHQAQSITLILLKQRQEAVAVLTKAIAELQRIVGQEGEAQIDTQRQLGSCWRLLATQEEMLASKPTQQQYSDWLKHLDQAKQIHERLFQQNGASAEIRFDFALTCYSRARVLIGLAQELGDSKYYSQAFRELGVASGQFKELATDFRRTPTYEYHRIAAIQLQAVILADQRQHAESAVKLEEADSAIRAFNENYPKARQDNLRLRICLSGLELGIDTLSNADLAMKKSHNAWMKLSFRELSQSSESRVAREAGALVPAVDRFAAAILAEEQRQPLNWLRELKGAYVALSEYSKAVSEGESVSEYLRLKLCTQTLNVAREYEKKKDAATVTAILEWLPRALDELMTSKNEAVRIQAEQMSKAIR